MSDKIFALAWYNHPEDFGIEGVYVTREAAEADIPRLAVEYFNERAYVVEEWAFTYPLDPMPWVKGGWGSTDRAASMASQIKGFRFEPRIGFNKNSADYAERGGIDPLPWFTPAPEGLTIKGRTRWESETAGYKTPNVFAPREGFEQDRRHYA